MTLRPTVSRYSRQYRTLRRILGWPGSRPLRRNLFILKHFLSLHSDSEFHMQAHDVANKYYICPTPSLGLFWSLFCIVVTY